MSKQEAILKPPRARSVKGRMVRGPKGLRAWRVTAACEKPPADVFAELAPGAPDAKN